MPNMVDVILQGFANAWTGMVRAFELDPGPFVFVAALFGLTIAWPFVRRAARRRS
ncbi:hypothetical protein ACFCVM_14940 [Agromyces sp. NPDC056389]|uniref:hypothetical protein n=1 Tax=Agromyces sp. NPDC056389 TaxID=3345805 RepID=UPI0035D872DA